MTNPKEYVRSFNEIRSQDLPLVGGKGANLGELTHAGFPVPTGFCLTTAAFTDFMDAAPSSAEFYDLLDTVSAQDTEEIRKVGERVQEALSKVPIPADIVTASRDAWHTAGENNAYAVRSSATAEDLPDASFAGQQDTYLNIIGEEALLTAIRNCWLSLFTDRAITYRCQNDFSHREVQLSVVVQKMIMADTSGILFTADPLSGHRHTLSIDASFGLGEALVSGLVSPDAYQVDKRNRTIINRQIADKQIAIFPEKDGGTRQETLSQTQQTQKALDDQQILALADMGCQIEGHYGSPQDIEWSIADGELYLLQARPITSLYPIDGLQSPDESLHIYFSMGHQQNMTDPMTPTSISSMQSIIPLGRTENGNSTILRANQARLFMDLTTILRHPILHRGLLNAISTLDARAPEALRIAMQRPEFRQPHGIAFSFSALKNVFQVISQIMHALWRQDYTDFLQKTNRIIADYVNELEKKIDAAPAGQPQAQVMWDALLSVHRLLFNWGAQLIAGEAAKRILTRLASKRLNPEEVEALSLGLSGNSVTDMNLALGDLTDIARQSPQLCNWFNQLGTDSHEWLDQAAQLDHSAPFLAALDTFIADYGARGPSEIDILMPRWYEQPLPLLKVIASNLQKEAGSHRAQHESLVHRREEATAKLLSGTSRVRMRLIKRLIYVMSEGSILREHHKFMVVQVFRVIKERLKKLAVQLTDAQKLVKPDDIWFLTWPEIVDIWDDTGEIAKLIPDRRTVYERNQNLLPPLVITSDGETPVVKYQVEDAPAGAMVGNPVSPGVVEGTVRVIHNPQTEILNPGEILVAVFTDPGWTPLFINAGGLIMEVGGMMTHGSVVAREYGIPAIVGVQDATNILRDGQQVSIDGNRGIIEVL
ncbi:MAG: phosphoenolpyruvate synthase [Chloroflexi bacterium]|nr:MAG: phosphoenolpyruvate synthase [Chloroflexota bacterium]MBL1195813.1 phosphoenolpyruvate synthase [Chloroflexota bacterium]NOH13105.1 phosphoenolpyruvate synthase [Chloroflexota bacterium]